MSDPAGDPRARAFLERAVSLAARGALRVDPNPRVGCLIVRNDSIVGEGAHEQFGGGHAEVNALAAAGPAANGATLYVTLEPCSTFGKTPPCIDAIERAGITQVVFALADPNPKHAGAAAAGLRTRGVACEGPLPVAGAEELLQRFQRQLASPRPFVIAKWAMTLDGKTATRERDSQWITSEESRARSHRMRGEVDAIVVGAATVRHDRPRLTARPPGPRIARRVVFSRSLEGMHEWPALRDCGPEIVFVTSVRSAPETRDTLSAAGARIVVLDLVDDREFVRSGLVEMRRLGIERVMVEGGGRLLGSFFDARCIDQVCAFVAPRVVGGDAATPAIGGRGCATIAASERLVEVRSESIGDELVIEGYLDRTHG